LSFRFRFSFSVFRLFHFRFSAITPLPLQLAAFTLYFSPFSSIIAELPPLPPPLFFFLSMPPAFDYISSL